MTNDLLLLSGTDIPFPQAQIVIHQPRIKEISFIGEESFFLGCEMLNFSKDLLNVEDKISLENISNFDVLMSVMGNMRNPVIQKNKVCATMLLTLMFPNSNVSFSKDSIDIAYKNDDDKEVHKINSKNFEAFKDIVAEMFCLKKKILQEKILHTIQAGKELRKSQPN